MKAAFALFCERGYMGTTMAQIAEAAGVAVQTVYFTFHTKAAVLSRSYDFAVTGEGEPRVPWEQPWYTEMVAAAEVAEALRHLVSGVGDITRRLTPCTWSRRDRPRATRKWRRWSIVTSDGASMATATWSRYLGPRHRCAPI